MTPVLRVLRIGQLKGRQVACRAAVPIYEVVFDYRLAEQPHPIRGRAFILADTPEHAEQVLRVKTHFRRAVKLDVRNLEEASDRQSRGLIEAIERRNRVKIKDRPSGWMLAWNVYPNRKTGE